jgi:ArsR family transcriptional regulator
MVVNVTLTQHIDHCQYLGDSVPATNTKAVPITVDAGPCCASVVEAPLSDSEAIDLARLLGALADPVRLRLLSLVASHTEICSCDLEAPLAKSQPTISHHTKVLAEAGLLIGEKRGRWMWWRVDPAGLAAVRAALGA